MRTVCMGSPLRFRRPKALIIVIVMVIWLQDKGDLWVSLSLLLVLSSAIYVLLDCIDYRRIEQGRHVAQVSMFGHVT